MEIFFIHANYLLLMLIVPVLYFLYKKRFRRPSIVIPSASLIKKILKSTTKPGKNFATCLRCLEIIFLIFAASEPMAVTKSNVIRIMPFAVIGSFALFLVEIIFKNVITKRTPAL